MSTPHNGDQRHRTHHCSSEATLSGSVSTVEHCLCGVTGFFVTGVLIAPLYPTLVAVTQPLYLLSSTALTVILVTVWILVWLGLECLWEWRAGRLTADT